MRFYWLSLSVSPASDRRALSQQLSSSEGWVSCASAPAGDGKESPPASFIAFWKSWAQNADIPLNGISACCVRFTECVKRSWVFSVEVFQPWVSEVRLQISFWDAFVWSQCLRVEDSSLCFPIPIYLSWTLAYFLVMSTVEDRLVWGRPKSVGLIVRLWSSLRGFRCELLLQSHQQKKQPQEQLSRTLGFRLGEDLHIKPRANGYSCPALAMYDETLECSYTAVSRCLKCQYHCHDFMWRDGGEESL